MTERRRRSARPAAPPAQREVGVREAMDVAMRLHRQQSLPAAEEIYRRILGTAPEHPDALHYLGVLCHQTGRGAEAVDLIRRSIDLVSDHPDFHNNLGNVLKEQGRAEEAEAAYRHVIALRPEHADAHNNLGVVLKEQERLEEAHAAYARVIALRPDHPEVYDNLGTLLQKQDRTKEALAAFRKAIEVAPHLPAAYRNLGYALYAGGQVEEAAEVFRRWLRQDPGNPIALHLLSACSGDEVPARASDDFVRETFDSFAASFEDVVKRLDYRGPELVAGALAAALAERGGSCGEGGGLDVLDAGCGTGLCAPLLRPHARRLVGVDLSPLMLSRAADLGAYDELCAAELTAYLAGCRADWDAIVSADTLVYFGDLAPVLRAAAGALRPGGALVFTVEGAEPDAAGEGFRLNPHGRYSHTAPYLRRVLAEAGLTVRSIDPCHLRTERSLPVDGFVVVAELGETATRVPGVDHS